MNLAVYEWRKLFRLPALWAFLALCLAFAVWEVSLKNARS